MRTHVIPVALALALASIVAACEPTHLALDGGSPDDGGCTAGSIECACDGDAGCTRGQCVGGVCRLCSRGDDGCLCRRDGTCRDALVCDGDVCGACPAGSEGCACGEGDRCDEGYTCTDGACAPAACPPGTDGCACRHRTTPECDDDLACLGSGTCVTCAADHAGCPCASGGCSGGLVCEDSVCRTPRLCADLVDEGTCAAFQVCVEGAGSDATCTPDACETGYVWDRDRCVAGTPNCAPDRIGSLLATCASQLRTCVDDAMGTRCGACIGDTREVGGVCVGRLACGEASCAESEYCVGHGETAHCEPLPCPPGEAREGTGACDPCGFTCAGEGLTGRVHPFRTNTGACVCETLTGYFVPPGGDTRAELCDADGDQWVRDEVRNPALASDPALVQNARCDLIEVDGVILRDESGVGIEVASCFEGLLLSPEPSACSERILMPLVESLRNDTPGDLASVATPAYGGRLLRASEVNGLSKACVSGVADFDDDGTEDLLEAQTPPDLLGPDPVARLRSFAYFMETHRAYPERRPGLPAKLVIEERYRCDPHDFPLRYDPAVDPATPTDRYGTDATYWRSCQRGADPSYDPDAEPLLPGFDFAQWSCPNGGAGCDSIVDAAPHGTLDFRTPLPAGAVSPAAPVATLDDPGPATLCALGARLPADRLWRGMHHHSQFRCVGVGTSPGSGAGFLPVASFGPTGEWVMNACVARTCDGSDPTCAESRRVSPTSSMQEPILSCHALASPGGGTFGFAARRYRPYGVGYGGAYAGGCISEDQELATNLCPAPLYSVSPVATAFGRETCEFRPCAFGRADCDGNPLNGCELDARTADNCNGCGFRGFTCRPEHAAGSCSTGLCRVLSCSVGWGNCDGVAANGCETNLATSSHCGSCTTGCPATSDCSTGTCRTVSCAATPLRADCDLDGVNGCERDVSTITDCGSCGNACGGANVQASVCTGSCFPSWPLCNFGCGISSCVAGYGNCDSSASTGCETDLRTSTAHCGACGHACASAHASAVCAAGGVCDHGACDAGYDDCDFVRSNGCEINLRSSPLNCGRCGTRCDFPNAVGSCSGSACGIAACLSGYSNCDATTTNGCEVRHTAPAECGSAEDLGSVNADTTCGVICTVATSFSVDYSKSGRAGAFYRVRMRDNIGVCSADLEHRITLRSPPGADFDLFLWGSCGGALLAQSIHGPGDTDEIVYRRDDDSTDDGSFNYWIEVRHVSGGSCSPWTLDIEGRHGC